MYLRARRRVATVLPIGVMIISSITAGLTGGSAGADGILPPANPGANIAPSSTDWLSAIDAARAQEGVGTMNISESALAGLPESEQMFAVVNVERVDRGLRPIEDMTGQLNSYAQAGANAMTDPPIPSSVTGGGPIAFGGSLWAGVSSALEADYYMMYDDGYGGSATSNVACSLVSPSGCWVHRDIILHDFGNCPTGPAAVSMGAASSPSGSIAALVVSSCAPPSDGTLTWGQIAATVSTRTIGVAPLANGSGYWEAEADGTVAAFGAARNFASFTGRLNAPVVGITATPDGGGYWLVASDGGIFSFGDAAFHGSMGGRPLNRPVVGMADDPVTGGYWEVASDGGIFSFQAPFYGSTGSIHLNKPIVGIEASPNGQGYRFAASDGGIFTYGNATFDGSTGSIRLASPVVGMASDNATNGYWMAAADGGIFTFGGAAYLGRLVSSSG